MNPRVHETQARGALRIHYKTFGCKTNQYDTERMRQLLEARLPLGPRPRSRPRTCA